MSGKSNYELLNTTAGTNNQLAGYTYDTAGNMTIDGSATYTYDAENRLIWTNSNSGYRYIYDGDGERVEKCVAATATTACPTTAGTGTLYWRGTNSDPLTETDAAGNVQNTYVFFAGQRVARVDGTGAVHYYFSDHLGTRAVVENATGTACEQDVDYYPYGGEQSENCQTPVAQNYKFTGKERDTETGLDNFGARYNTSNLGRFMTPDWAAKPVNVPYAHFGNPQSLNLYAYVENNPTTLGDPDGHEVSFLIWNNGFGAGVTKQPQSWSNYSALDDWDNLNQEELNKQADDAQKAVKASQPSAQNTGEGSQANLDRRQGIADAATDTKQRADLGQKQYGPNQCSAMVAGCIAKAGAKAEFDDSGRPPVAGEWANKKANIPDWRVLGPDEKPQPGDVAAVHIEHPHPGATGDSAIVVMRGNKLSAIQAGFHGVEYNSNFVNGGYAAVVYRRYTGD